MPTVEELMRAAIDHHQAGRLPDAEDLYRQILATDPQHAGAWHLLGVIAHQTDHHDQAVACIERAIALAPEQADFYVNLGTALASLDRYADAIACFHQALRLNPDCTETYYNLGNAYEAAGDFAHAEAGYLQALERRPDYADALNNYGDLLRRQGRLDAAVACFDRALAATPGHIAAHFNRSFAWLLAGNFSQGWDEYEWRWQQPGMAKPPIAEPAWDGSPIAGRTILLYTEQGLGDTLHMVRYARCVKQLGARVLLHCQEALVPLLSRTPGIERLIPEGTSLPKFDWQLPLMSVPRVLRTTLATVPADIPYINAAPSLIEAWRPEIERYPGLKIGIVWQGNPDRAGDRFRSVPLAQFLPLLRIAGTSWFSLQKGPGLDQLAALEGQPIVDLSDRLDKTTGTFMDTAAVMRHLDLVITPETSPAQLAGALGAHTWTLLSSAPDWRWLLGRDDTPWYPNMRLFRQTQHGVWDDVFVRLGHELRTLVADTLR